jgi:hypothetical protein
MASLFVLLVQKVILRREYVPNVRFFTGVAESRRSGLPNIPTIRHIGASVLTATASQFGWNQHSVKGSGEDSAVGKTPLPFRELASIESIMPPA